MTTEPARQRIAVIAVHGVADQQPGESADAVAALLLNLAETQDRSWLYEPFQARTVQVPLSPAVAGDVNYAFDYALAVEENAKRDEIGKAGRKAGKQLPQSTPAKLATAFRESRPGYRETLEQGSYLRGELETADQVEPLTGEHLVGDEDAGLTFMRALLGNYQGDIGRRSYVTTRLEGARRATVEGPAVDVDLYEMYWADLSRVGSGPLRVFNSLYQLVLHVSELGRRALEDGLSEFARKKEWKDLLRSQEIAVRLLTVPIPLLNLVLLLTVLNAALVRTIGGPFMDPNRVALRVSVVLGAVALSIACAYWLASKYLQPSVRGWWSIPVLSVFVGAAVGYALVKVSKDHSNIVLVGECWIASLALINWVLHKYERLRPGALVAGLVISLAAAAFFVVAMVVALISPDQVHPREVEYAALWTVQFLNILLSVALISLFVFALLAAARGHRLVSSLKGAPCSRARAAVRTSRLALAISASTMLGVVTISWSGLLAWGSHSVGAFECMQALIFPPFQQLGWLVPDPQTLAKWLPSVPPTAACPNVSPDVFGYASALLLMGTTTGLPLNMLLVSLSLMLLIWMAMPSVMFESAAPASCTNRESKRAGVWLSRGLDATKIVTHLWWASVFVAGVVFGLGDFFAREGRTVQPFGWSMKVSVPILSLAGTLVAAFAAAIVFGIAKFGGSALDVLLDVDNYLRERPLEGTPRARIAERYASLLRYVAHDRSKNGKPYDSIIIVAHSLGALISADLLRFFSSETRLGRGDPSLAPIGFGKGDQTITIPIHLFTMGNPLRQLLSRFFPHQYRWVRSKPDNSMKPMGDPSEAPSMPRFPRPSPGTLGVASWTNAYRSGDYVGRGLWLDEWFARTTGGGNLGRYPQPIKVFRAGNAAEMCIGLGAHTHYWDHTAPDIRDQLDYLIVRCGATAPIGR
jgi:hypothetical protein